MTKKNTSRTKRVLMRIIKVREWGDVARVQAMTTYLVTSIRRFFIPQKADHGEAFETAKSRLKLTDTQLLTKQKGLFRAAIMMLVAGLCIFIYALYHLSHGNKLASFLSIIIMLVAFMLAFRYHFWYFQIKEKKLGCTLQEWFKQGILGEKR